MSYDRADGKKFKFAARIPSVDMMRNQLTSVLKSQDIKLTKDEMNASVQRHIDFL